MKYLAILPLLLAVSLAWAFNMPDQGNDTLQQKLFMPGMDRKEAEFHPRIINGKEAAPIQFGYTVAVIFRYKSSSKLCGGALLSNRWVLTVAYCTKKFDTIKIRLGINNLNDTAVVRVVRKNRVFPHPEYTRGPNANIALIMIPPVKYTRHIQPVGLPQNKEKYLGSIGIASGWGYTSNEGPISLSLRYANLTIIDNSKCAKHYGGKYITARTLCTDGSSEGVCISDTGGPLISKKSRLLIGLASFGPKEGCGKGFPDGFTRVDEYLGWIQDTTILYTYGKPIPP